MAEDRKFEPTALCYALLALITVAVYLPVIEAQFITFDDTSYLTENPKVQAGLTWEGVRWAFTRFHAANWHPLAWLSHMLDCELYGLRPGGHHLTSLLLHTANTLLLFGLLRRLTGAFWRSALVAALFALHPLHVESVAWVAERKDVLSTCFFLLALRAYVRSVECGVRNAESSAVSSTLPAPCSPRPASAFHLPASLFYLLSLLCFALGLMSKPMLVTLPFVLLLLDYWPLGRMKKEECRMQNGEADHAPPPTPHISRLLLEKLPFLALSAASCVVTVIAQQQGGAVASFAGESAVSLESRIVNTPISYAWYLAKLVWPSDLAVIYPYVRVWPLPQVLLATALLAALTGAAFWLGRRRPYALVGWFWYLGTLVPVIGLVKVGVQSIADRYLYIPSIGLFVLLAWGVADLTAGWARRTLPLAAGAAAVLTACALATGRQLLYWLDTESLFRHTLAVTQGNYLACNSLGFFFAQQGQHGLAKQCYQSAIEIAPNYAGARNNLGATLVHQQQYEEAIATLEGALSIDPQSAETHSNLGAALFCVGKTGEAIEHLRQAIHLKPEHALAHFNLGNALLERNQWAEAAEEFRLTIALNPRYVEAHQNLALALAKQGKPDEAVAQFREVLRLQPNHQPAWVQVGLARVKQGRLAEAVEAFSAAVRLKPDDPEAQCHLAAALAAQHQAGEAVAHYREALKLLPNFPEALNNLAWILAAHPDPAVRNGGEAIDLAERACKLTDYKQPLMVGTLAAAYAEAGRFAEAVTAAEKARILAEHANQMELADRNRALLELYRSGQPARDVP